MPYPPMSSLPAGHPYLMTPCECGCTRFNHSKGRGMCCHCHCHCSRFKKRTRQFVHVTMMRDALLVAIDAIESLPGEGRSIKVGIPDMNERVMLIKQMQAAIAGPKVENN